MLPTASATVLPPDQRLGSLQVEPVPVLPVLDPVCDPVAGDQDESVPAATGPARARAPRSFPLRAGDAAASHREVRRKAPPPRRVSGGACGNEFCRLPRRRPVGWARRAGAGRRLGALGAPFGVRKTVLSPSGADVGAGARGAGAPAAGTLAPPGARNRVLSASICARVTSASARYASPVMRFPRYRASM